MRGEAARRTLDRQQIVAVALELLREGGLKAISIRRLADAFGIKSTSLYHHFRDKQDLLDHISAAIIQPAFRPAGPGEPWQDYLIAMGYSLRDALRSYREGALVAAGSTPPPDTLQDLLATLYAPLFANGYDRDQCRHILVTMLRFVGGWTFDEQVAEGRGVARDDQVAADGFDFALRAMVSGAALETARRVGREP